MGSKNILLMKFGQFMLYCKKRKFTKKIYKTVTWKLVSDPFCVCKELSTTSIGKWNYWSKLLILDIAKLSKGIQISIQDTWFLFTEYSLKIKKGLELVSRSNFITRLCLFSKLFNEICFVFHAWAFDNVMTFEYLKR